MARSGGTGCGTGVGWANRSGGWGNDVDRGRNIDDFLTVYREAQIRQIGIRWYIDLDDPLWQEWIGRGLQIRIVGDKHDNAGFSGNCRFQLEITGTKIEGNRFCPNPEASIK